MVGFCHGGNLLGNRDDDDDDDDDLKNVIHPASTQARPSPNQSSERILNKNTEARARVVS